jgi:hypothetical protein
VNAAQAGFEHKAGKGQMTRRVRGIASRPNEAIFLTFKPMHQELTKKRKPR